MVRRFVSSAQLLSDLLDRWEAGSAEGPLAYPDHTGFPDITSHDRFLRELEVAERVGAVSLSYGAGRRRGELKHVRLASPERLYEHLGRDSAERQAADALRKAVSGSALAPALETVAREIADGWARRRRWCNLGPADWAGLRTALSLAQAVLDGRQLDQDYRTFSRRVSGDSKALERLETAVVSLLRRVVPLPPDADARSALATLGLERFGPPILLSGQFLLDGFRLPPHTIYFGLPPAAAGGLCFPIVPAYVLTIENFASFNRHVSETDPERHGLTLYAGGYPSLAVQRALASISAALPSTVPFYHWSDIDPDGTWIFRTVEKAIGRLLLPHLMTVELAERHGDWPTRPNRLRRGEAEGSAVAELVDFLASDEAKYLEQEEIDPRMPLPPDALEIGPASHP